MVGQELTQHLQHIEEQLAKLMKSYQDYKSRDNVQKEPHVIPVAHHFIYVTTIIILIITATYTIGSLLVESKKYIEYIAVIQAILSAGFYIVLVKQMTKAKTNDSRSKPKVQSNKSIYELDQLRFEILQELASSPIPQNYITPTAIKRMHQLVKSGMCITIEECMAYINKEKNKQKHEEELQQIQYLQTISYH